MTVQSTVPFRKDYTADGSTNIFAYPFQIFEAGDLTIYLNGVVKTLNTDYTVSDVGNASGGNITFTMTDSNDDPVDIADGDKISIVMDMDLDRDTNYQPSGAFLASTVNNDFDRLWLATNQQAQEIDRSLRLKADDITTSNMEIPAKDDRKGKLLGFNATTGDPEVSDNNKGNWNAAYNDTITSASFSGGNYTLTQRDGGTITTSFDGRYLKLSGGNVTGTTRFIEGLLVDQNKAIAFNGTQFVLGTSGNESFIREGGTGDLSVEAANLNLRASPTVNYITATNGGAVSLYHNNSVKLATTSGGISVTGTITATGYNSSNWDTAYNDKINSVSYSNNTLTLTQQDGSTLTTTIAGGGGEGLTQTLAIGNTTGGNDISFGDNDKALFGASDDLQIYHDGSDSYVDDAGVGDLVLRGNNQVLIRDKGTNDVMVNCVSGQFVKLYYNNAEKLATSSTGIDVTGTVTADGLTVYKSGSGDAEVVIRPSDSSGDPVLKLKEDTAATRFTIRSDESDSAKVKFQTDHAEITRLAIDQTGDISFYEDTGTTPKFFWDASAERLNLTGNGTSLSLIGATQSIAGGNSNLKIGSSDVAGADKGGQLNFTANTTSLANYPVAGIHGYHETVGAGNYSGYLSLFTTASGGAITERLRIDSSGNVGIGTTSPQSPLHVAGDIRLDNAYYLRSETSTGGSVRMLGINAGNVAYVGPIDGGPSGTIYNASSSSAFASFYTAGSEKMRIDSSGNVLMGQTSTADYQTAVGSSFRANGFSTHTRDGGDVLLLNRLSSDGSMLLFRKDNTTVGSISTNSGNLSINSTGSSFTFGNSGANIHFDSGTFRPFTGDDNTVDLGSSSARFKDIHLSGSGYFGTKVGIGTTSPAEELHISAAIPKVRLQDSDGTNQYGEFFHSNGTTALLSRNNTGDGTIVFQKYDGTTVDETMRIDSSGNVLVGKTSDSINTVGGQLNANGLLVATRDGGNTAVFNRKTSDGNIVQFRKDNTIIGSIGADSNSQLVIGSGDTGLSFQSNNDAIIPRDTDGSARTQLINLGTTGAQFKDLHLSGVVNAGDGSASAPSYTFGDDTNTGMFSPAADTIAFTEGGLERMRITSSGNVGIGTTSPSQRLHVNGGVQGNRFIAVSNNNSIANAGFYGGIGLTIKHVYSSSSTTYATMISFTNNSDGEAGRIRTNGSSTQYVTTSDERLKENIQDAGDAGSKIDAIRIRQFDWIESGEHEDFGVIAQELQSVAPEAVSEGETADDMMGVDYSKLVPTLIKEIQSLRNRVAELENN